MQDPTTPPKALYLATHNEHKASELQNLLGDRWLVKSARDLEVELDTQIKWSEIGETFEENAKIKALALRSFTTAAILADDSGLVVDALGGRPGVHSSRFANCPEGTPRDTVDQRNLEKLLAEMTGVPEEHRTARFVCCLYYLPEQKTGNASQAPEATASGSQTFIGTCEGRIAIAAAGSHGFGYDPAFIVEETDSHARMTMAMMSAEEKNRVSHRAAAIAKFLARTTFLE